MTRKINHTNYEVYMIDYLDGSLSLELEEELCTFLNDHPKIKLELEGLNMIKLESNSPSFDLKENLKKRELNTGKVNQDNFEEYAIGYYENDLQKEDQEHLLNYIHENNQFAREFESIGKLQLLPNHKISYPTKENLKQFACYTHEAISADNYEDFLIASKEGDLAIQRQIELDKFIDQNPAYKKEANTISQLTLKANSQIIFENKAVLKRRIIGIPSNVKWLTSAAASIALLFASQYIPDPDITNYNVLANQRIKWHNEVSIPITHQKVQGTTPLKEIKQKRIKKLHEVSPTRSSIDIAEISTLESHELPREEIEIQSVSYPMHAMQIRKEEVLATNEKEVKLTGLSAKVVSRMTRILGKGKRVPGGHLKGQSKVFVEYALLGYNTLTESDRSLQNTK